ncbi:hypothetical protein [Candidatus Rariloculus sp.]|uniref:hypothetical protein n=1 Tax=Candidatus Rariloculus sp. TaxID=3101265 RepID=UPI003D098DCA
MGIIQQILAVPARNKLLDNQPDKHQFAGAAGYLGADFPLNHPSGFNGGYHLRFNADL